MLRLIRGNMARIPVALMSLTVVFLLGFSGSKSVRITDISMPEVAIVGDDVKMQCRYDESDGEKLYSLKWYKDGLEFFRHVPSSEGVEVNRCPTKIIHALPGVTVNCWESSETEVVLTRTSLATSGDYKCETISELPYFRKQHRNSFLTVYEEPLLFPRIDGAKKSYALREILNLTCLSFNREYAPHLSWLINGTPAPEHSTQNFSGPKSRLLISLSSKHFRDGLAEVTCLVSFGNHSERAQVGLENLDHLKAQEYQFSSGAALSLASSPFALILLLLFV